MAIEIHEIPIVVMDAKRGRFIAAVARAWADDLPGFVDVLTWSGYTDHEILAGVFAYFRKEIRNWVIVIKSPDKSGFREERSTGDSSKEGTDRDMSRQMLEDYKRTYKEN